MYGDEMADGLNGIRPVWVGIHSAGDRVGVAVETDKTLLFTFLVADGAPCRDGSGRGRTWTCQRQRPVSEGGSIPESTDLVHVCTGF